MLLPIHSRRIFLDNPFIAHSHSQVSGAIVVTKTLAIFYIVLDKKTKIQLY